MADTVSPKTLVFCDLGRGYFLTDRYSIDVQPDPLGQFFSKDNIAIQIFPLIIKEFGIATTDPLYSVSVAGLSCSFALYDTSGNLLASQNSFTSDATAGVLNANLNCDTVAMGSYVSSASAAVIIEARFTGSFGTKNVRATTTIKKALNYSGSPVATPGVRYPTWDEMQGALANLSVQSILFTSPDTTKKKLQYLGDDDSMHMDEVT